MLFLQGGGARSWGKIKAGSRGVPTSQPELGPTPHLLLEQGLDSVLPVPDALAQLCLLDELLRGGNEELLGEDQGAATFCAGAPCPAAHLL